MRPPFGVGLFDTRDGFDHTSVVDQNIQPTEIIQRCLNGGLNLPVAADIAGDCQGGIAQITGQFDDRIARARQQHNPSALYHESAGRRRADATTGTRDHDNLSSNIRHSFVLVCHHGSRSRNMLTSRNGP